MDGKEKLSLLFDYIKQFSLLKTKIVKDVAKQPWHLFLSDIPIDDKYVKISYRDGEEGEELLKVQKPDYSPCPKPDYEIAVWIDSDWENFKKDIVLKENHNGKTREEFFEDQRLFAKYDAWYQRRAEWVFEQKHLEKVRDLFTQLYRLRTTLEKDSEIYELMIGEGIIKDKKDVDVNHPILLRKIDIDFDAEKNIISFSDSDAMSEVYSMLLNKMPELNYSALADIKNTLYVYDYHPLDRVDARKFLKEFTHTICAESKFIDENENSKAGFADRIVVYANPVFFLRKKVDGTAKLIEKILENLGDIDNANIPKHLIDIVSGGKVEIEENREEPTISQRLAAIGGEDENIFLAKEANSEQLEIAKRISKYNAVLVQGPPGTGKTHTIANLLGNFLAEGKTVLVTSQTKKALSVLKEKIPENIQSLCVSLLDDKNADMERSVDGITEMTFKYDRLAFEKKANKAKKERLEIINSLADVRKKIYDIKFKEFNPIVYNGERVSPIEAAKFVNENADELAIIPGKVELYKPLPLSFEELSRLYRTNGVISSSEEKQLGLNLPCPEVFLSPKEFDNAIKNIKNYEEDIYKLSEKLDMEVEFSYHKKQLELEDGKRKIKINIAPIEVLEELGNYIKDFKGFSSWKMKAVVDGMRGGSHTFVWNNLINSINEAVASEQRTYGLIFDKDIVINSSEIQKLSEGLLTLKKEYREKGKVSLIKKLSDKNIKLVEETVLVDGEPPKTEEACIAALFYIELNEKRKACEKSWNKLIASNGEEKEFYDLNDEAPEGVAKKFIPEIERCLGWYVNEINTIKTLVKNAGINPEELFEIDKRDSEEETVRKIVYILSEKCEKIVEICKKFHEANNEKVMLNSAYEELDDFDSDICDDLYEAYEEADSDEYVEAYKKYVEIYNKYSDYRFRKESLEKIYDIAPEWAKAIRKREGIHGEEEVPSNIEDAWKWKQYSEIISDITKEPFGALQEESVKLSKKYRKATAEVVEWEAWYHLSKRTEGDISMRQALNGWKQTIKKIGKGTGKYAAKNKAKARELMYQCQEAVPAWIMPLGKVIENFEPGKNLFDIMIVDESSQSDISSLAALYLAKKVIIVGDDKQVSPMSVGLDLDEMGAIVSNTIENKIPNSHLYDGTSSLYDIAGTVYQPLMLKEHFRCVPEIIGYSNKLSYNGMIKPLRDINNVNIFPSVVNYRVDGHREFSRKINIAEARTIVAAIEACIEREEYKGKTFGIITLLGEQQARYIENLVFEKIDINEIEERKILCGNSAQFQGDERDVIFLSMVDSNEGEGPLSMKSDPGENEKKRYNVAASRARDQLWVVNSLDETKDLKAGDLRRGLIEYAKNPASFEQEIESVTAKSESVFEESVAKALVSKGYKIVPQWQVGAYRIDMVAVCGKNKIAIECDGEMWHSGEEKIREDMERQTILERTGWRFIRIRGSEYFRNPEEAMKRVFLELEKYGIEPTDTFADAPQESTELLDSIKARIDEITTEWDNDKPFVHDPSAIEFALRNSKEMQKKENKKPKKEEESEPKTKETKDLAQISLFDVEQDKLKEEAKKPIVPNGENDTKGETLKNGNDYSFTIPKSFVLRGEKVTVTCWRNLYVEFVQLMFRKHPQKMENMIGRSINGKGNIDIQTKERSVFMSYPEKVSETIYLETNLDINAIVERIIILLKICGEKRDDFSVEFYQHDGIEEKITRLKKWTGEKLKGDGEKNLLLNLALASDLSTKYKLSDRPLILEDNFKNVKFICDKVSKEKEFVKMDSKRFGKMKKSFENYMKYLSKN